MSDDKKQKGSLTDEDMITSPKMSRRVLLATAGVALGAATLGGHAAFAEEKDAGDDQDASDKEEGGPDDKDPDDDEEDAAEKDEEGGPDDKDPEDDDKDQQDGEMDNEAERDAD